MTSYSPVSVRSAPTGALLRRRIPRGLVPGLGIGALMVACAVLWWLNPMLLAGGVAAGMLLVVLTQAVAPGVFRRRRATDRQMLFSVAMEDTPAAVIVTDWQGTITYVNKAFVEMTGYSAEEAVGRNPSILQSGQTPFEVYEEMWATITAGRPWRGELLNRKKNGELYWEDASISQICGNNGDIHYVAFKLDISERKRTFQEMEALARLPDENPEPVLRVNRMGDVLYANKATRDQMSLSLDGVPKAAPEWLPVIERCLGENAPINLEQTFGEQTIRLTFVPLARVRHVNIYGHDITTSKRTEAMLRQDMKMEAIGTLAGGIAHDFNNILTSILGYNHLILGDVRDPEALAMDVRQIHMAASRAKELTRQILTFSRDATDPKSPIDLAAEIFEASQFVKATVPKNITVALDLDVEGAVVMATPGMIHQIVVNLSTNAVDAIGDDHGRITLKLRRVDGGLEFSMTDTGEGIPVGMRERIFDPFFTTKEVGKGTGLGLSVVHGIVEDLGGRITVESPPEGGCRIVLRLPEADAEEALRIRSAPGCGVEGQAKDRHVLVVDDEPSIVDMLRRFFERMGHRVTATSDSNGALALVQTVGQFDLVLADHMMPGITGITLARAIADQAPGTPVVLCSGRNDKVTLEEMRAARVAAFVLKPFNLVELADTVECLLRDGRANKVN